MKPRIESVSEVHLIGVAFLVLATAGCSRQPEVAVRDRVDPPTNVEKHDIPAPQLPVELPPEAAALFAKAEASLAEITHPVSRAGSLGKLTTAAARAGDLALAERLAVEITDERFVPGALAAVGFAQSQLGLEQPATASFGRAVASVDAISSSLNRARSLAEIAGWLHAAGRAKQAERLLAEGSREIVDDEGRAVLAAAQGDLGWVREAMATEAAVSDSTLQRIFLAHLARSELEAASSIISSIGSEGAQDFCRLRLAQALGRAGELRQAEEVASAIRSPEYKAVAYAWVASAHAQQEDGEQADRLFRRAEELRTQEPSAPYTPIWVKSESAIALAQAGRLEKAQTLIDEAYGIASGIEEDYLRPSYVEACAVAQAYAGDLPRAREMLSRESEGSWRNGRGEIMAMLVRSGELATAIEWAEGSQDPEERLVLFGALAAVTANPTLRERIPVEPRVVSSSWLRWFFGMILIE